MLPLLAAVPAVMMGAVGLVGGAMSMAGGAMSMAGGVMAAGSTMAGIAADAAGGVIGAATSLTGGGKSAPEAEARAPADQSTSDEQGAKALPPGVKLNKNGVMIQDSGGPGGGRILPGQFDEDGQLKSMDERLDSVTADRSGASPVNQILDYVKVIAANTARTAMGIGALMQQSAASTAQDNIDDQKVPPEKKQGMVSKVFGGLTSRMKKINESLGGVAKFMLKGLGLAGLIYLFKKHEETVTKAVASIFKFFHNLYKSFEESDDPMGDLMKFLKGKLDDMGNSLVTMFKEFYKATVEPMLVEMMTYINNFLEGVLFGKGEKKTIAGAAKSAEAITELLAIKAEGGLNTEDPQRFNELGLLNRDIDGGISSTDTSLFPGDNMTVDQRTRITAAGKRLYQGMWEASMGSGGAIQWTNMPFMSKGLTFGKFVTGLTQNSGLPYLGGVDIEKMMKSQPIINGNVMDRADLVEGVYDPEKLGGYNEETMSADVVAAIKEQNINLTNLKFQEQYKGVSMVSGDWSDWDAWTNTYNKLKNMGDEREILDYILKTKSELSGIPMESMPLYIANHPELMLEEAMKTQDFRTVPYEGGIENKQLHRNLQLYLKHLEQLSESGQNKTVLLDSSSNDNRMTKQGDTIQMAMSVDSSDYTARLLTDMREVSV